MPVESVLILLAEQHAPRVIPSEHAVSLGSVTIRAHYRVIRLWELDPAPVFTMGRSHWLPWVSLMKASQEEIRRAAERVAAANDQKLTAQFAILGSLRYDKDELRRLLERFQVC